MNILTIAAIGAGLYLLTGSKKSSSLPPSELDKQKGFKVVVSCKEFEIYNGEASAKWMYDEVVKQIEAFRKNNPNLTQADLLKISDAATENLYGCKTPHLEKSAKYYKWGFDNARAGIQAFVDKQAITKNEGQALLTMLVESIKNSGFDTSGLNITL